VVAARTGATPPHLDLISATERTSTP